MSHTVLYESYVPFRLKMNIQEQSSVFPELKHMTQLPMVLLLNNSATFLEPVLKKR